MAPWNHTEHSQGKQVAVVWGSRGRAEGLASQQEFEDYLDDVGERTFPGWKSATIAKSYISHAHHWMNPLYIGPKVPRRSPTYESLWYCGDGTTPVSGLASEQAAFAGRHGAESILIALGKQAPNPSLVSA
jgi:phytoene dehydrogenase-like protein